MSGPTDLDPIRVSLVHEQLSVGRRAVETDRVRVRTVVDEVPVSRTEQVQRGEVEVERVAVERAVDTAPQPYAQDGVWIVPIIEERLIVEKRLFVVEELRIRHRAVTRTVSVTDTVRHERAVIERDGPPSTGDQDD